MQFSIKKLVGALTFEVAGALPYLGNPGSATAPHIYT